VLLLLLPLPLLLPLHVQQQCMHQRAATEQEQAAGRSRALGGADFAGAPEHLKRHGCQEAAKPGAHNLQPSSRSAAWSDK
jgi:hypothetical protein